MTKALACTLPINICRHYDVEWISSNTCRCHDCGKQGFWTPQGVSIWVRTGAPQARRLSPQPPLAKVG